MKLIFLILFLSINIDDLIIAQRLFGFIVATDGTGDFSSVQAAIDACPEGERSLIFIKNGTYAEQVSLGSKSLASTKKISLIGESRNGVLITQSKSRGSSGSPTFEDVCTVKLYATDFYAENITIQNAAGNTGMAEALYTAGDRQTFKNCSVLGYQDTYRSKKGTRGYFKNSWIEGAVDFIYAGGTIFFDDCTINCVNGGGYITAPEDAFTSIPASSTNVGKFLRLGFIFRNCNIAANPDVASNTYYLGRPWNNYAGTFYISCKLLGNHIKPIGWQTWGGNENTASFAEYNSLDVNGNPIDITNRVTWSFQLPKSDVDNFLKPEYVYARGYTDAYDPITMCISPSVPSLIYLSGSTLSWNAVENAAGYLVFKNGRFLTSTTETSYTDNSDTSGPYTIKSISSTGTLSDNSETLTDMISTKETKFISEIKDGTIAFDKKVNIRIISISGKNVVSLKNIDEISTHDYPKGWYILKTEDRTGNKTSGKILIN